METIRDQRQRTIRNILQTLRHLDDFNLTHMDAKMLDKDAFIIEVMMRESISKDTALRWFIEANLMNSTDHEGMLKQEARIRRERKEMN